MSKIIADLRRSGKASLALLTMMVLCGFAAFVYVIAQDGGGGQPEGAISCADLKFGDPLTLGSNGEYDVSLVQSPWLLAVLNDSGLWQTNPPTSWYVPAAASNDTGKLSLVLDRSILTNNAVGLSLTYFDAPDASLFLDLVDSNAFVVATNFAGNIFSGSAVVATTNIMLPLAAYPEAMSVELRRGAGEVAVYEAKLFADLSGTNVFSANSWPARLLVNNGQGSGWYPAGRSVSVSANPAVSGQVFNVWTGDANILGDRYAQVTTATMPANNATVAPAYIVNQPAEGSILRAVFSGIAGTNVLNLTTNALYPNNPTLVTKPTSFEAPQNFADSYGTRMYGYVHPPVTGDYTFWIASDDGSQLWLSSSENPIDKVLIASVAGATTNRQWTKYPSQQSAVKHLEVGRKYYIEAIHKENSSSDNLSVAWQGPGIVRSVIAGNCLSPFATNFVPVAKCVLSTNLTIPSAAVTFRATGSVDPEGGALTYSWNYGDGATGTGLSNVHAYASAGVYTAVVTVADSAGASSVASGVVQVVPVHNAEFPSNTASGLEYKYYEGIWSNLPVFEGLSPVRVGLATNFNLNGKVLTTNFAHKLTGYIQVATNGIYTFYSSSDDGSKLFVGNLEVVSNDGVHTAVEKSGSVWLAAGKHAITVQMFQNNNATYSLTVSYAGPGITKKVIPSNVLFRQSSPVTLTVTGGTGSGAYEAGWTVPVYAGVAASGTVFGAWSGDTGLLANAFVTNTILTMPAGNAAIAANYMVKGAGTIQREVYTGITGATVSNLTGAASFPNAPTLATKTNIFEIPQNYADNYGTRLRGYVHAPATGSYTFWIAADERGELWLSTTEEVSNKVLIASVPARTGYRSWTNYPAQKSALITLEANKKYYIEALQKESTTNDHLSVSWQTPGSTQAVISAAYLSPVVTNFAPYAKLVMSTNLEAMLKPVSFSASTSSDPEGSALTYLWSFGDGATATGVSNQHAYAVGGLYTVSVTATDSLGASNVATGVVRIMDLRVPENPANTASGLEYKYYEGVWSSLPNFDMLATVRMGLATNFNLNGKVLTTNFAYKLTGYVQVPTNGAYTFYTSSDDGSKLFIGSQLVVTNDGVHTAVEKSGVIWLAAGKHAITVQMFQNNNATYSLTVSYAGPGITKKVIPSTVLFRSSSPVTLTVTGGTGSGVYEPGWTVPVTATAVPSGTVFAAWVADAGALVNPYVTNAIMVMPVVNAAVSVDYMTKGSGTILREVYSGISGAAVSNLTSAANFPYLPTTVTQTNIFEIPQNAADNYGTRLRGYLSAPVTGSYTFWIAADERGELWLSTDEESSNKVKIASVPARTGYRSWTNYPTQKSALISLEGKKRYYIEALHKESTTNDNLSVAWQTPGCTQALITAAYLTPVAANVAPYARLTVNTNYESALRPITFSAAASSDPEGAPLSYAWTFGDGLTGTGVTNLHAYASAGTYVATLTVTDVQGASGSTNVTITVISPRVADVTGAVENGLVYRYYEGSWSMLPDFAALVPVRTGPGEQFNLNYRLHEENYGVVLSGYIDIPAPGIYTFYVSSDDGSKLYIGEQEVVSNDGSHGMTEKSGVICLGAGKHAITVKMFQGGGGYGLVVSYAGPGVSKQTIPAGVLYRQVGSRVMLTVSGGNGGGMYEPGWTMPISAVVPAGKIFKSWSAPAGSMHDPCNAGGLVTIPVTNLTVSANFISPEDIQAVLVLDGTNTSRRTGSWAEAGSSLNALKKYNIRAEYLVPITNAGMYQIGVNIQNSDPTATAAKSFSLYLLIDELPVASLSIPVPFGSNAWAYASTPWLAAGNHTVRFAWLDNYEAQKKIGINFVTVQSVGGPDADANGCADWVDAVLVQGCDTDGDGLGDLLEIELGSDVLRPDTDGDGLFDGEELSVFGTDPLVCDSTIETELNGVDAVVRESNDVVLQSVWFEDGSNLVSKGGMVFAYYDVTVTNAGICRLVLQVQNYQSDPRAGFKFQVVTTIDGVSVGTLNVAGDVDLSGRAYVNTPWLVEGSHRIGFKWINPLMISYQTPGAVYDPDDNISIEKVRLYSVNTAGTNGLSGWEIAKLQAAGDSDGDGISDYDEVVVNHTNPTSKDTDNDGLNDNVELAIGTDPNNADTDGDGVTDGEENKESLTDPLNAEFSGTVIDVCVVNGAQTNSAIGNWKVKGTEIVAESRRGYVEYLVTNPQADMFRIKVDATHLWHSSKCSPVKPVGQSDLQIYVDGIYLGKKTLVAPEGIYGSVVAFTPWLKSGTHVVRVYWENVQSKLSLKIKDIRLQQLDGPDANNNGVKDWVEKSVSSMAGLDVGALTNGAGELVSLVSPACIEGISRYVEMTSITVDSGAVTNVNHGVGERWYADVPLVANRITPFTVSFMSGALQVSTNLTWISKNLLENGRLSVRKNDALMFTAVPAGATNGVMTVQVFNGSNLLTNVVADVYSPVVFRFEQAGDYTVAGLFDNGSVATSGVLSVKVVGGAFPTNVPAFLIGQSRSWACPDLPTNLVLETDSSVALTQQGSNLVVNMSKVNDEHYVLARASSNGAIVASSKLTSFWIQGAVESYVWKVAGYPDGSGLYEDELVMKNLPADVDVKIAIVASGVTLDDMTTERWLKASDFNNLGEYKFRMVRSATSFVSVCHTVTMYQNGVLLGEAYYNGLLMPQE